jgi:HPt (histidine-containing phosphotransfer) domain-containing protein
LAKNEAQAAPNPGAPVDLRGFRSITDGDKVFAHELVATFIASGERQLAEISYAVAGLNREALAKAAHQLKGACANIHAHGLKFLAEQMESESSAGDAGALQRCDTLLRREFERVRQFLSDPSVVPEPSKAAS